MTFLSTSNYLRLYLANEKYRCVSRGATPFSTYTYKSMFAYSLLNSHGTDCPQLSPVFRLEFELYLLTTTIIPYSLVFRLLVVAYNSYTQISLLHYQMACWYFPRFASAPSVKPNLDSACLFNKLSIAPPNRILLLTAIINAQHLGLGVHPLLCENHFSQNGSAKVKYPLSLPPTIQCFSASPTVTILH